MNNWSFPLRMLRGLFWVIAVLILLVVLAVGGLWIEGLRALPKTAGTISTSGLSAPVDIGRDRRGIPIITAANDDDASFALGYVHAQDRLFEMELMRRQGQGRLAELVGPLATNADRFMRTLGVYRRAEADLAELDPAVQRQFQRYADGVNAWLSEHHPLPLEFQVLWFKPEPWKPADSLVWQKLMGLDLSGNWDDELFQAALIAKLGPERAGALEPAPRPQDAVTLAANDAGLHAYELYTLVTSLFHPTTASNVWTVAGARTDTGKPLLANDPHLNFQSPSIWYFVGVETPDLKLFGVTIPGVPLLILGHNQSLAWGLTTTNSDTSDLFIEQVAADGKSYRAPEGDTPFITREETIKVRFGEPLTLTVRETRHGPVVSDLLAGQPGAGDIARAGRVLALSATLLAPHDLSAQALYKMNRAGDVDGFIAAMRDFDAPHQNIMVADTKGNIAYYAPGRVPMRKSGDGRVPAPGWTGDYDWAGWIPFEELPHVVNPPRGSIVNANNKMVTDDYPYLIAARWPDAYRANRITELLAGQATSSVASMETVQLDVVSLMAKDMLPLLIAHAGKIPDRALVDALAKWDGTSDRARWEPLLFALWAERTKARLVADDLGPLARDFGGLRPNFLRTVLSGADPSWCDDVTTPQTESCDDQVAAAWSDAFAWLKARGVGDVAGAHWGDFHIATFGHLFFRNMPVISGLGEQSLPSSGDTYTVNTGSYTNSAARRPLRHTHGASMRAVYDLSDLSRSQFALPGGESGQITSPHYGDLLRSWRDGEYFTQPKPGDLVDRLRLAPGNAR